MPEKEGFSRLKLVRTGDMPPAPMTPAEFATFVQKERKKYRELVKTSGAKAD